MRCPFLADRYPFTFVPRKGNKSSLKYSVRGLLRENEIFLKKNKVSVFDGQVPLHICTQKTKPKRSLTSWRLIVTSPGGPSRHKLSV